MRILLVGPEREENLSLRYLSSSLLAAGHRPEIARFDHLDELATVLRRARGYPVVGLSMCFQARAREFLALATAVRAQAPRTVIVAGGHYATCAADDLLLHHPELDLIVLHEGEQALVELAATGVRRDRFPSIAGLLYRDGAELRRTATRPMLADLDRLPFPDRRGHVRRSAGVPTAYVMGSRGCYSRCDYCCIITLHRLAPGPRFRQRSVANVADEMAELYHQRGVRQFVFHDDNFLVPSARRNHERLDALAQAWAQRGMRDLGLVIKCRPADLERSVLQKLVQMGLLRMFLGVESASPDGLCSIGRRQEVVQSDRALALARDLGVSTQFTLMCFHPEATVSTLRADLDFFRRHREHALNFCRTEIYAGTPLEARMRDAGRAHGDYLGRAYVIRDAAAEAASKLAVRAFYDRCWSNDSLMESAIGLDHLMATLCHFEPDARRVPLTGAIASWHQRVNDDLIDLLSDLVEMCERTPDVDSPTLQRQARRLVLRERATREPLLAEGRRLRRDLNALAADPALRAPSQSPRRRRLLQTAAASYLAASVAGCGGLSDTSVSEYAPPPLQDSDGDGLPDECEQSVFGTDPELVDSDADGTADGDENHDGGMMTNAEEQEAAGQFTCEDVDDTGVSEYAPPPLEDTDGDGLPDECEETIFGTDPTRVDTDEDGVPDGDENHDLGMMTNAEEQQSAGDYQCQDVDDTGINEFAAAPLDPLGSDEAHTHWARAIFDDDSDTVPAESLDDPAPKRPSRKA